MAKKKAKRTAGTTQLGQAIDTKIFERMSKFAKSRSETKRVVIEQALTRHMDSPPPKKDLPPLPDAK